MSHEKQHMVVRNEANDSQIGVQSVRRDEAAQLVGILRTTEAIVVQIAAADNYDILAALFKQAHGFEYHSMILVRPELIRQIEEAAAQRVLCFDGSGRDALRGRRG